MKRRHLKSVFRKVLVPVTHGCDCSSTLAAACAAAGDGEVILVGMVRVPEGESLSAAALSVREVRQTLKKLSDSENIRASERVFAAHNPWSELVNFIQEARPDLLMLEWKRDFEGLGIPADAMLHPPCDVAIVGGPVPDQPHSLLVPVRGGPYAELALQLSLAIARNRKAELTSLHISVAGSPFVQDAPFRNIDRVLVRLKEVKRQEIVTADPVEALRAAARQHDLVVMGASARPDDVYGPIGPVAQAILDEGQTRVIVVKTKRPIPARDRKSVV
jgi:nucleotide-binding universal stress UspA family protein